MLAQAPCSRQAMHKMSTHVMYMPDIKLTLCKKLVAGGWGLQLLSVTFQSSHFCPILPNASLISGTYWSGRVGALQKQQNSLFRRPFTHPNKMISWMFTLPRIENGSLWPTKISRLRKFSSRRSKQSQTSASSVILDRLHFFLSAVPCFTGVCQAHTVQDLVKLFNVSILSFWLRLPFPRCTQCVGQSGNPTAGSSCYTPRSEWQPYSRELMLQA